MIYSFIIPLYNRPDEIRELLESLVEQTYKDFEVIVVEDGSTIAAEEIVKNFSDKLRLQYFFKANSGQGFSRNFGMERAVGEYFIILDSDCILPTRYLEIVDREVRENHLDAFGGPDRAHQSFTVIQKAISYSMTSFLTTGGIRGGKKRIGRFYPRSFNMGISRRVYQAVGGFIITRMGEDIEYSIRIIRKGFSVGLIEDAFVYHKRRTNFLQFFRQVHFFGRARINISRFDSRELNIVHLVPAIFTVGSVLLVAGAVAVPGSALYFIMPLLVFMGAIFFNAIVTTKNFSVSVLAVAASLLQMYGYGSGILREGTKELIQRKT